MIFAFDTYYTEKTARTVCVGFEEWTSQELAFLNMEELPIQDDYESGQFYKRELPCILSLLEKVVVKEGDVLIVDGFVFLDEEGRLGLGGHLYESLSLKLPVIGVAKNNFATISSLKRAVFRGESKKPLYVTAIGMDLDEAAENIGNMAGTYRMPDLLKKLDLKTKEKTDS
ncbi:MAG: endonuclease V [Saprospiraceae bacterium]|nr:endonuclease V [Saprospiraceae bacterium]